MTDSILGPIIISLASLCSDSVGKVYVRPKIDEGEVFGKNQQKNLELKMYSMNLTNDGKNAQSKQN